jgi:SNF2 family DNA or RNA helicase
MTGTAFNDRPLAAFGQMRFINPRILGDYNSFFDRHVNWYTTPDRPYVKIPQKKNPYKNHAELAAKLAPYLFIVDGEKVLDLPNQQDIYKRVVLTPAIRKAYNAYKRDYITELEGKVLTAANAGVLALRLHQLVGEYSPKVEMTLEILEEIDRQPCVVFVSFQNEVAQLERALHAAGFTTSKVTGEAHQHLEFQRGDTDICIVNMAAGAEGIDLTRARFAIYYSVGYSRSQYVQSRYRVRRSNSEAEKITFFHLITDGTVDAAIYKALEGKEDEEETLLTELGKL